MQHLTHQRPDTNFILFDVTLWLPLHSKGLKPANNYRQPPSESTQVGPCRPRSRGDVLNLRNVRNTSDRRRCGRHSPIVSVHSFSPIPRGPRPTSQDNGLQSTSEFGSGWVSAIIRDDLWPAKIRKRRGCAVSGARHCGLRFSAHLQRVTGSCVTAAGWLVRLRFVWCRRQP